MTGEKSFAVMNTWFNVCPLKRFTWISPGDRQTNQIDTVHIIISNRCRSAISKVQTYPGAAANSDLMPVVANIKLHLNVLKIPKRKSRFMLSVLKKEEVREKFRQAVIQDLDKIDHTTLPESHWNKLRTNILQAAGKTHHTKGREKEQLLSLDDTRHQISLGRKKTSKERPGTVQTDQQTSHSRMRKG